MAFGSQPALFAIGRRDAPSTDRSTAAAMTIRTATTGFNGTNAPMTVSTAQVEHCSLADAACVLTDGSYAPFSPCLTDEPSNGIGEAQDNYGAECHRRYSKPRLG